jgi:subtilisin family serine protease
MISLKLKHQMVTVYISRNMNGIRRTILLVAILANLGVSVDALATTPTTLAATLAATAAESKPLPSYSVSLSALSRNLRGGRGGQTVLGSSYDKHTRVTATNAAEATELPIPLQIKRLLVEDNQPTEEEPTNSTTATSNDNNNSTATSAPEFSDKVRDEFNQVVTTNPMEWTSSQKVGVAIGITLALLLVALLLVCCVQRYRQQQAQKEGTMTTKSIHPNQSVNNNHQSKKNNIFIPPHKLQRPYVIRKATTTKVNAHNYKMLPLGVKLHGAVKLRTAGLTGKNVRVAVIDSGIDKDHPGFHGQVKRQVWFRSGTPLSEDDHGTHVAGTIHLMAPDAELYDYRVFGKLGGLDGDLAIATAIREAVDKDHCHVINMSLRVSYPIVPAVQQAVQYAYKKGVYMVAAAGNSGDGDPTTNELYAFPARWAETISVAAVAKTNGLPVAYFSESNPEVDFAAIGVDVVSLKPGGGYQTMQGTSMAAPHVTGLIAALLTNKEKKYTHKSLRKLLSMKYAIDIGTKGTDTSTGVGFLTYLSSRDELTQMLNASSRSSKIMKKKVNTSSSVTTSTKRRIER